MNTRFASSLFLRIACAAILAASICPTRGQNLIHRYSFDEDARDLVGGADGELVGDASISNGAVTLSGTKPSYVNLPNDLIVNLTNVTFEIWVSWNGGAAWQRIWDFGNNDNGEDLQGAATQSIFLTPNNGGGLVFSIFPNGIGGQQVVTGPALQIGGLHQIVWTYDNPTKTAVIYVDGAQAGINKSATYKPSDLGSTVNNWLGHSQYIQDADFAGSIAEFRIYDGALSAATVAADFTTGPDPSGRGALVSLDLVAVSAMRPGSSQQLRVTADFANVTGLDITSDAGLTFEVNNSAILTVGTNGVAKAVDPASGTATVTAKYQGKSSSKDIQVIPLPAAVLIHRYSFATNAADSIGNADGQLVGDATISQGAVVLTGNKPSYVNLPNDLFSGLASASFETWVTWNGGGAWQRIWDFGNGGAGEDTQGAATQSIFLTPDNGGGMQFSIYPSAANFGQQVINAPKLTSGQLHHIVWSYDDLATTGVLYLDGAEIGINQNMTFKPSDLDATINNWLGHSQYIQDADFNGSIAEFRVYNGALTAAEVTNNFIVGPNPSGRGALLSIALSAQGTMLSKGKQQVQVKADYENVAGVDITADTNVLYEVTDLAVLSVGSGGLVTAVGTTDATASVKATFLGKSSSKSIHVVLPVPPTLIHRYSFSTDASDSVGTANGTLVGSATISGDAVVLDGIKPSYVDFPNDLVAGLTDATFEIWLTWGGGPVWQRIWDFGNSTQGEDQQGAANQSIFLTPNNGGVMDLSIFPNGIGGQQVINGTPLTADTPHHIVWTYSKAATSSRLFVDGVENGSNVGMTYTLSDLAPLSNVWLGHSQYVQDADLTASITEFRIFRGTFSDADVAADFALGPDVLASDALIRKLTIKFSSGALTISWPTAATGFGLEASATLGSGAVWGSAGTPTVVGTENQVTIQNPLSTKFYRLKK